MINKEKAMQNVAEVLVTIRDSYSKLYDRSKEDGLQQAANLLKLADTMLPLSAVMEVCARDNVVSSDYVLEKLNLMKHMLEKTIDQFETKGQEMLDHDLRKK